MSSKIILNQLIFPNGEKGFNMNIKQFTSSYETINNKPQSISYLKIDKGGSVKIIIPKNEIGIIQALYVYDSNRKGQTLKVNAETYKLLLENKSVPMVKSDSGEYPRKPQTKGFLNVLEINSNQLKVWEISKSMIQKLDAIDDDPDCAGLTDCIIKVSARSTGNTKKDVQYDVQVIGKAELTDEQEKLCENLYDVEKLAEPHSKEYIIKFLGIEDEEEIPI
jgi:hypothetical protein